MEISIFLAKALGLYLLTISVGLLLNASRFRPLIKDILKSLPLLFFSGFVTLILGILLVLSHNLWVTDWRIVITLMAWLVLIKGALRVMFPQWVVDISKKWVQSDVAYYTTGIIVAGIGVFLCYHGNMFIPEW